MERLRGPVYPSTAESMGTLLDAYDRPSAIMMAYNPPYYPRLLESAGLIKANDMVALAHRLGHARHLWRHRRLVFRLYSATMSLALVPT